MWIKLVISLAAICIIFSVALLVVYARKVLPASWMAAFLFFWPFSVLLIIFALRI